MSEMEELRQIYDEEMKKIQDSAFDLVRKIVEEHERKKATLEARRVKLELREIELEYRQALNEIEKRKLDEQKKMNEMAIMEQKKDDEKMLKLAAEQKRQKELLQKKIIELEVKLDQKEGLELQIQGMRGAIEVMKHITNAEEGDMDLKKTLESVEEELEAVEEGLAYVKFVNDVLFKKERVTNEEVQEARKQLIDIFSCSFANICVKRMGELDHKPFIRAAKLGEALKPIAHRSMWEIYLRDPSWHPYKVVVVEGSHKEILDENDEKLKELKTECDDKVYEAVITALNEMNEYSPRGRHPVNELWNSEKKRKASLTGN